MLSLIIPITIVIISYWIFNPYMSFVPKDNFERWTTNERSYGWPYYWKMKYQPGFLEANQDVYNHMNKHRYYIDNVMIIE